MRSRLSDGEIVSLILEYVGSGDTLEVSSEELKALVLCRASAQALPSSRDLRVGVKRPRQVAESTTLRSSGEPTLGALGLSENIKAHLRDLRSTKVKTMFAFSILLRRLMEHKSNRGVFNAPVDYVKLGLTTYLSIVKRPLDLGTIRNNLLDGKYEDPLDFFADVKLVFENAMLFNPETHYIYKSAKFLLGTFTKDYHHFATQLEESQKAAELHSCQVCEGRACCLCKRRCLELKRSILRCSAPCNARIQRNHVYYRNGGDRGQHWCQRCYSALPKSFIAILGQRVEKSSLQKLRNDAVVLEHWATCTRCHRAMHQVCTLHNPLVEGHVQCGGFVCFQCDPTSLGNFAVTRISRLSALKHSSMGVYLEKRVKSLVRAHLSKEGEKDVDAIVDSLTLRVVACTSRRTHLEPRVERWIQAQRSSIGAPFERRHFDHVSKTLLCFQAIDGVDVLLFVLYVQEYGNLCAEPNRNKVYVSYLDSISYMTPRSIRSVVYQQTMMGYIAWVRARGFRKIYIWACPPKKEDAYIINCHPKWQRTPSAERLRKWYGRIIDGCRREGSVLRSTNMYDAHLSRFRPLVNTRSSRRSSGRSSRASSPVTDRIMNETGIVANGRPTSSPSALSLSLSPETQIDTGLNIVNPVENMPYFYGDYLPNEVESVLASLSRVRSKVCQSDELVSRWWEAVWGSSASAKLVDVPVNNYDILNAASPDLHKVCRLFGKPAPPLHWKFEPTVAIKDADVNASNLSPNQRNEWLMRKLAASIKPMRENFLVLELAHCSDIKPNDVHKSYVESKEASPLFEEFEGEELLPEINLALQALQADTSDPDGLIPAGIFDTRLFFLDFCQANHLQFDELRRAKHSSLMLLFALQSTLGQLQVA